MRAVVGDGPEIEVVRFDEGPPAADLGCSTSSPTSSRGADPEGTAVPLLLSGATDARHLAALGVRTCGFTPVQLPEGFDFTDRVHAADERIPADAVEWGADRVYEAVTRYDG